MSYKLIENENDIYVELPKEKIKFASEAETIYDLSLENDFLTRENEELKLQLKGTTHCYDKEEHKRLQEENQELKKQLEIKHNGFMASVEEACELAKENQKYKEVIDKAIKLINKCVEAQLEEDYLMNRVNLINYNCNLLDILKEVE